MSGAVHPAARPRGRTDEGDGARTRGAKPKRQWRRVRRGRVAAASAWPRRAWRLLERRGRGDRRAPPLSNKFHDLDPTHFRLRGAHPQGELQGRELLEMEVHLTRSPRSGSTRQPGVRALQLFRTRLADGARGEAQPVARGEARLPRRRDGRAVLLSLLVLIFTAGGEDLTKLLVEPHRAVRARHRFGDAQAAADEAAPTAEGRIGEQPTCSSAAG